MTSKRYILTKREQIILCEESFLPKVQRAKHTCHICWIVPETGFFCKLQYSQFAFSCELWWSYFRVNHVHLSHPKHLQHAAIVPPVCSSNSCKKRKTWILGKYFTWLYVQYLVKIFIHNEGLYCNLRFTAHLHYSHTTVYVLCYIYFTSAKPVARGWRVSDSLWVLLYMFVAVP